MSDLQSYFIQKNKSLKLEDIMKKSIIIISSLLMVALIAGSVFAWGQGKGKGRGMGYSSNQSQMGYGMSSAWNDLSQEQRDSLTALKQKHIDETYDLRSSAFTKQQEVRMLMETSDPDRAKLSTLTQELSDLQRQMAEKRIDYQLEAKKIAPELTTSMGYGKGRGGSRGSRSGSGGGQGNCTGGNCTRF